MSRKGGIFKSDYSPKRGVNLGAVYYHHSLQSPRTIHDFWGRLIMRILENLTAFETKPHGSC